MMKKIINDPNQVVPDMLEGLVKTRKDLAYLKESEVVYRKTKTPNKVGIVSGGGAGHEPAHGGYVGVGMLDAAVSGNVFASPSPDQILEGIQVAHSGAGVLLIVKNYSGDIMNFEMAQEMAQMEGVPVSMVVVKDDVAVEESTHSTGRRGIAGTVLVHKVAGAKAASGGTLEEVAAVAQKAIHAVRSFGCSLSSCTIPAVGKPGFEIPKGHMELGMGIHGEPGVSEDSLCSARELAHRMIEPILTDLPMDGEEIALMINGLGSTPLMELYILANEVYKVLATEKMHVAVNFVGNFMTSLEMAGCSISLMKLDDELKSLLESSCDTAGLTIVGGINDL